jgi:DNA polymerase III gamma/tau subunit
MNRLLFLHIEIKYVLEILDFIPKEDRIKLMAAIDNLDFENLLAVLKVLYKIEREYVRFIFEEIEAEKNPSAEPPKELKQP